MERRNLSWGQIRLAEIVLRSNLRLNIVQRVKQIKWIGDKSKLDVFSLFDDDDDGII